MEMVCRIPVRCRTNLDGYERSNWPEDFFKMPVIGERVEEVNGHRRWLKIVGFCHKKDYLEVELNR